MFFKRCTSYKVGRDAIDRRELNNNLREKAWSDPLPHITQQAGWANPMNWRNDLYHEHVVGGASLLCLRVRKRLIPADVVTERLDEAVRRAEGRGERIRRSERAQMRDEVILSMMPQAFIQSKHIYGYIDFVNDWLVIDSTTDSDLELFVYKLREACGEFNINLIGTDLNEKLTDWAQGEAPEEIEILDKIALSGGSAKAQFVNMDTDQLCVSEALDGGMFVDSIKVKFKYKMALVLDGKGGFKQIKPSLSVLKELDNIEGDAQVHLDAEFSLMVGEFAELFAHVDGWFAEEPETK